MTYHAQWHQAVGIMAKIEVPGCMNIELWSAVPPTATSTSVFAKRSSWTEKDTSDKSVMWIVAFGLIFSTVLYTSSIFTMVRPRPAISLRWTKVTCRLFGLFRISLLVRDSRMFAHKKSLNCKYFKEWRSYNDKLMPFILGYRIHGCKSNPWWKCASRISRPICRSENRIGLLTLKRACSEKNSVKIKATNYIFLKSIRASTEITGRSVNKRRSRHTLSTSPWTCCMSFSSNTLRSSLFDTSMTISASFRILP